ncbi:hypothetical protein Tco_0524319 [Tanacetum coccineum]
MVEPEEPLKKKDQLKLDEEMVLKLQAEIDEEERLAREKDEANNMEEKKPKDSKNKSFDSIQKMFDRAFKRVNTFVNFRTDLVEGSSKRAGTELEQEVTKKEKVDDVQETAKVYDVQETAEVDDIIRVDGSLKMYLVFSHMLKSFDMEDLETLWKLVKAKHGSTRPEEGYERVLWGDLKVMFEPHVEDIVWRNQQDYRVLDWKLYDSCGSTFLKDATHEDLYVVTAAVKKLVRLYLKLSAGLCDLYEIFWLKRLYKVGLAARVESFDNKESLGKDASKQGRIDAIDADEEIPGLLFMSECSCIKPKKKRIVLQELGESTTIISSQLSSQQSRDKGKGILIEPVKPMNKKDLIRLDKETALSLQAEFDKEEILAREKAKKEEEVNIDLIETWDDIQRYLTEHSKGLVKGKEKRARTELVQEITKKQKVEDDKETTELKQLMKIIPDEDEVAIDAIPLAVKSPMIVDWKIYKEGRKSYYQIIRADEKSQMYMFFSQMLKKINREDLKDLYKLVKAKYESTRPVEDLDLLL